MKKLEQTGVTLKKEKCQFYVRKVKFLGHVVDENGIRPDPSKVAAINEMSEPRDLPQVRRILGTINQLGKFVPGLSDTLKRLNELLKKDREFVWEAPQRKEFKEITNILTTEPVLSLYDPKLQTKISADSSSYGLGACLLQINEKGKTSRVSYASRTLTATERRYA